MLTVLTQGPPFLSRNGASARGCLLGLRPGNRLIARHPLLLVHCCLDQARIDVNPLSAETAALDEGFTRGAQNVLAWPQPRRAACY